MIHLYEMTEMKKLDIPEFKFTTLWPDLSEVSYVIEKHGTETDISVVNWQNYGYRPEVIIFSGYTNNEILLKYRVEEQYVLGRNTCINSPVYKDSCVEFFISSGNGFYYNFEFNCIGTSYAGYGEQREGRVLIEKEIVSTIRTYSTLGDKQINTREIDEPWELTIAIPFSLFKEKEFLTPREFPFKANFYKCGDNLPIPHYLTWNPVGVDTPDFHRPEFFGDVIFL
ncbi:MAG: hypothetical protein KAH95_05120 [Spirochaetales bacterium]|nr:hypothetical protein [Spirochaetales bacterium]